MNSNVIIFCQKKRCYYRGIIHKINEDGRTCNVKFVDYGSINTVFYKNIFESRMELFGVYLNNF